MAVVWLIALGGQYFGRNWSTEATEPFSDRIHRAHRLHRVLDALAQVARAGGTRPSSPPLRSGAPHRRRATISWRPPRRWKDRHHLDVPAAAFVADEPPVLGHVNEDHIVPELQFLERLDRLMVAAEAMDCERGFACARHSYRATFRETSMLAHGGSYSRAVANMNVRNCRSSVPCKKGG